MICKMPLKRAISSQTREKKGEVVLGVGEEEVVELDAYVTAEGRKRGWWVKWVKGEVVLVIRVAKAAHNVATGFVGLS